MTNYVPDPEGVHVMWMGETWFKWEIPYHHMDEIKDARLTVEVYARSHEEAVAMALSLRMRMNVDGISQIIAEIPDTDGVAESAAAIMFNKALNHNGTDENPDLSPI